MSIPRPSTRTLTAALAPLLAAAGLATATAPAGATGKLVVSTSDHVADHPTVLNVKTALSGFGNATHEYGTQFTLPPSMWIEYYSAIAGSYSNTCSASAFSLQAPINTGYTPAGARGFDVSYCPETAKVGTVSLGNARGFLYIVNVSPVPQFAIYLDQGVATPIGRRMNLSFNADGSSTYSVFGLPNKATTGLSITFGYPASVNPGQRAFYRNAPDGVCTPSEPVTGRVWTFPYFGTATTLSTLTPATITISGCTPPTV